MTVESTLLRTEPKPRRSRDPEGAVTAPPKPKTAPRTQPRTPPKADPAPRPGERTEPAERTGRSRSVAAQRAYARRAHREGRRVEPVEQTADRSAGRATFVVLIIVLLAVGVAATLWLSTQAIADSYRLEDAKQKADQLAERAAELQREVTKEESASALAERARQMGMVPAGDAARLIVQPNGQVVVVGEPKPAEKPAPPSTSGQQQPPAQQQPAQQQPRQQAGTAPGAG